jgi:hypothetical protein
MPKSLEMSSGGLDFDRFMKAMVSVPKEAIDKTLQKPTDKRKREPRKKRNSR